MRICYLAPAESAHMEKWTERMAAHGHEIHVISLREGDLPHATLHCLETEIDRYQSDFKKLSYLSVVPKVRSIIRKLNPDVLHAHYASSYGLIASIAFDRDYYLSVWGSDVFSFPRKSPLHRIAIKHSLDSATWLMSTSKAMANESSAYTKKHFEITPFGVDMELFSSSKRTRPQADGRFVVGTVKSLEPVYGIPVLLKAVAEVRRTRNDIPIEVRIAGEGSQKNELKLLSQELEIDDCVNWLGQISQYQAACEWANMDAAIVMSESESFGVSSVEAQASGVPVIYSSVPGLMEAANDGKTGICLPRGDWKSAAKSLIELWENDVLRRQIGMEGRAFVESTFEIGRCFDHINRIYLANRSLQ